MESKVSRCEKGAVSRTLSISEINSELFLCLKERNELRTIDSRHHRTVALVGCLRCLPVLYELAIHARSAGISKLSSTCSYKVYVVDSSTYIYALNFLDRKSGDRRYVGLLHASGKDIEL